MHDRRIFIGKIGKILACATMPYCLLKNQEARAQYLSGAKRAGFNSGSTPASGISYLVNEQCETGQGSWTGSLNYAYTTAPAPLKGTKSFAATTSSSVGNLLFSSQTTVEMFFLLSTASTSLDNFPGGIVDDNVGTTSLAYSGYDHISKVMQLFCGTKVVTTVNTVSINTTYGIWLRYVRGSGTNDFASLEFAVSPFTRVGSGNGFCSLSNGDANKAAAAIQVGSTVATTLIFDNILVSTGSIPSNPP